LQCKKAIDILAYPPYVAKFNSIWVIWQPSLEETWWKILKMPIFSQ